MNIILQNTFLLPYDLNIKPFWNFYFYLAIILYKAFSFSFSPQLPSPNFSILPYELSLSDQFAVVITIKKETLNMLTELHLNHSIFARMGSKFFILLRKESLHGYIPLWNVAFCFLKLVNFKLWPLYLSCTGISVLVLERRKEERKWGELMTAVWEQRFNTKKVEIKMELRSPW